MQDFIETGLEICVNTNEFKNLKNNYAEKA